MDRKELLQRLDALAHMETDAMGLYAEAVNCARERNPEMMPAMQGHFDDHRRHAETIAEAIIRRGGKAPDKHFDAVGRHLHWPTMLRANPCKEGALEAIAAAENYHAHTYATALTWDVSDDEIAAMLRSFAADEERHREFVLKALTVVV